MNRKSSSSETKARPSGGVPRDAGLESSIKLEVVLKADSAGSVEAVRAAIDALAVPGVSIRVIQAGVGSISKKDVLMAQTGSRLIVGFNVDTVPRIDMDLEARCVEIRLYEVIYRLTADLEKIAGSLLPREAGETILGKGRIIAVFQAGHKGVVIGCEVLEGAFVTGKSFRLISPMGGTEYTGVIDSLEIERRPVKQAPAGRQAGILIPGRRNANIGDHVECFEAAEIHKDPPWHPTCGIFHRG